MCSTQSCTLAWARSNLHLLPHLYAVPVGISVPHVPQDGIHGTAVVELLFKLVRVTWAQAKEPFKWTVPHKCYTGNTTLPFRAYL